MAGEIGNDEDFGNVVDVGGEVDGSIEGNAVGFGLEGSDVTDDEPSGEDTAAGGNDEVAGFRFGISGEIDEFTHTVEGEINGSLTNAVFEGLDAVAAELNGGIEDGDNRGIGRADIADDTDNAVGGDNGIVDGNAVKFSAINDKGAETVVGILCNNRSGLEFKICVIFFKLEEAFELLVFALDVFVVNELTVEVVDLILIQLIELIDIVDVGDTVEELSNVLGNA